MAKKVSKVKFFQKTAYPVRYYIVDYTAAVIHIKHKKEDALTASDVKSIAFRDVRSVYGPRPGQLKPTDCQDPWVFAFYVETVARKFQLYAQTESEKQMWIAGFEYLIKSTREVQ